MILVMRLVKHVFVQGVMSGVHLKCINDPATQERANDSNTKHKALPLTPLKYMTS